MASEDRPYTIDLPGLSDIFVAPGLDNKQRVKERLALMRTAHSPLPKSLGWVPHWIAHLDDARQVLDAAAPVAGYLAPWFGPIGLEAFGWFLGVKELLEGGVSMLSLLAQGETSKQRWFGAYHSLMKSRAGRIKEAEDWIKAPAWRKASVALTRISARVTGYGIAVAPCYGAVSDVFWGGIRLLQGKKVTLRLPPQHDPLWRALRYLIGSAIQPFGVQLLSPDDQKLVLTANLAATLQVADAMRGLSADPRLDTLASLPVPSFAPDNPVSAGYLVDQGYDLGREIMPAVPEGLQGKSLVDVAYTSVDGYGEYEHALASVFGSSPAAMLYQGMLGATGEKWLEVMTDHTAPVQADWPLVIVAIGHAIEAGIFPPLFQQQTEFACWRWQVEKALPVDPGTALKAAAKAAGLNAGFVSSVPGGVEVYTVYGFPQIQDLGAQVQALDSFRGVAEGLGWRFDGRVFAYGSGYSDRYEHDYNPLGGGLPASSDPWLWGKQLCTLAEPLRDPADNSVDGIRQWADYMAESFRLGYFRQGQRFDAAGAAGRVWGCWSVGTVEQYPQQNVRTADGLRYMVRRLQGGGV